MTNTKVTNEFVTKLLESRVWETARVIPPEVAEVAEVVRLEDGVEAIQCPLCESNIGEYLDDEVILECVEAILSVINESTDEANEADIAEDTGPHECPMCSTAIDSLISNKAIEECIANVASLCEGDGAKLKFNFGGEGEEGNGEDEKGKKKKKFGNGEDEDGDDEDEDGDDEEGDDEVEA